MTCYCGNSKDFNACCSLIHDGTVSPPSAEVLMRARYSAFAVGNIDFLYDTFHPSTRRYQNKKDIKNWATENKWLKLEIMASTLQTVEFKAYFKDHNDNVQIHHEKSNFKELQGRWYYVDGRLTK